MDKNDQTDRARRAISDAWSEGCPVASKTDEIARAAVRRWNSMHRREVGSSKIDRVEDLAKGLVQRFEAEPRLVGPLVEDYRYLASKIVTALMAE